MRRQISDMNLSTLKVGWACALRTTGSEEEGWIEEHKTVERSTPYTMFYIVLYNSILWYIEYDVKLSYLSDHIHVRLY